MRCGIIIYITFAINNNNNFKPHNKYEENGSNNVCYDVDG